MPSHVSKRGQQESDERGQIEGFKGLLICEALAYVEGDVLYQGGVEILLPYNRARKVVRLEARPVLAVPRLLSDQGPTHDGLQGVLLELHSVGFRHGNATPSNVTYEGRQRIG